MAGQSESRAEGTYSVLHCHFESALRALSVVAPAELAQVRSVCSSPAFMRSGPAGRLHLLDQEVRRRTASTDIFSIGALAQVVRQLCDEMTLSCIDHIDLRIGVITDRWSGIRDLAHAIEFFHRELAARDGLSMSFLGAVNLSKSQEALDRIFGTALHDVRTVAALSGLDINMLPGDIRTFHRYRNTLGDLQKDGLRLSIHLGELLDNETSVRILSMLPPDRIGHGVRLLGHAEAMRIIGERDILSRHVPSEQHHSGCMRLAAVQSCQKSDATWYRCINEHRRPHIVQCRFKGESSSRPPRCPGKRSYPARQQEAPFPVTATIYIYYGVACSGKSTIALRHARERNIRTIVSTDYLREVQRIYVPSDQCPALAKVSHSAWELLGGPSRENIVRGFLAHAEAVRPAIDAVARKLARDGLDAIIEGTHFHGSLIDRLRQQNRSAISPALVTVRSARELMGHISAKESERRPGSEPKKWRANVSALFSIQEFLIADSIEFSIPVIQAGDLPGPMEVERDGTAGRGI